MRAVSNVLFSYGLLSVIRGAAMDAFGMAPVTASEMITGGALDILFAIVVAVLCIMWQATMKSPS